MNELKDFFREGLVGQIEALESAQEAIRDQKPEALKSVGRIARSLYCTGEILDFPEVAAAARDLVAVSEPDLLPRLETLLQILRRIVSDGETHKVEILVVEDDPEIGHFLQLHLASPNRIVMIAPTIEAAERILEEHDVALVLLDLTLPDKDGRNFLIQVRESPRTAALPVIVVSGRRGTLPKAECFALGADEYFEKPVQPEVLSAAVAAKIHRAAELSRQARRDDLTGLLNRFAFREAFLRAQALGRRNRSSLTLALIDFDHFKAINDTYGHALGDRVLRRAAQTIIGAFRQSDVLARWGGDEFVALFPETDGRGTVRALEKALESIQADPMTVGDGRSIRIAFSAGVAEVGATVSLDEAVARADQLLYRAKTNSGPRILAAGLPDNYGPPEAPDSPKASALRQIQ
jgi:diguanylate cyclase (GGDEF)-like protein